MYLTQFSNKYFQLSFMHSYHLKWPNYWGCIYWKIIKCRLTPYWTSESTELYTKFTVMDERLTCSLKQMSSIKFKGVKLFRRGLIYNATFFKKERSILFKKYIFNLLHSNFIYIKQKFYNYIYCFFMCYYWPIRVRDKNL